MEREKKIDFKNLCTTIISRNNQRPNKMTTTIQEMECDDYGQFCDLENYTYEYKVKMPPLRIQKYHQPYFQNQCLMFYPKKQSGVQWYEEESHKIDIHNDYEFCLEERIFYESLQNIIKVIGFTYTHVYRNIQTRISPFSSYMK